MSVHSNGPSATAGSQLGSSHQSIPCIPRISSLMLSCYPAHISSLKRNRPFEHKVSSPVWKQQHLLPDQAVCSRYLPQHGLPSNPNPWITDWLIGRPRARFHEFVLVSHKKLNASQLSSPVLAKRACVHPLQHTGCGSLPTISIRGHSPTTAYMLLIPPGFVPCYVHASV